jgi:tetratricopeptide (TPR) repeat protein/CHAT domain-containing protein
MLRPSANFLIGQLFLALTAFLALYAQEGRWKDLDNRAEELSKNGRYTEALAVSEESLSVAETTFGHESANLAAALNRLGEVHDKLGNYAQAEPLLLRSLAIREKTLGAEHPDVAESLHDLADVYWEEGKYAEAEPMYRRALAIREKVLGPEHPDVAESLNDLAGMYSVKGKYAEAEPMYRRALAIREKVLGPEHPDVAESLTYLGTMLYMYEGKYAEAEPLFQRAVAIDEKALGPDHPTLGHRLVYLARLYEEEGKYGEAELLFKRALAIYEKALGSENNVAATLNHLAAMYEAQGKYGDAESLFKRGLAIREKALGPEHLEVANALTKLAQLYQDEGRYGDAELLFERALGVNKKALGEHPYVARALENLAGLYDVEGRYGDAEPLFKRALAIEEKALGPEHTAVAATLNHLAALYDDEDKYAAAEPLAERALAIYEKVQGREHLHAAGALNNLGRVYVAKGNYSKAETMYQCALTIWENVLGPDHPSVAKALDRLAGLYYAEGKNAEAEPLFGRSLQNLRNQFERYFEYMSERERLEFIDTVSNLFPNYFSFCYTDRKRTPQLAGQMYDVLLWKKGLVVSSIASMQSRVAASGNKETLAMFQNLVVTRTRLASLVETSPRNREEWRKTVENLERESNDLEKQLVQRSASLGEGERLTRATWQEVREKLHEQDAAVEFVRFRFHNGLSFTDKSYYVALVVTPQTTVAPAIVLLGDAARLEDETLHRYRSWASRSGPYPGPALYQSLWGPLETALGGSKRIFLSPDGILNEISFGIIPMPSGGLLMERYDLRTVSSTRDLLQKEATRQTKYAVLVGNPKFDLTETQLRAAEAQPHKTDETLTVLSWTGFGSRSHNAGAARLSDLPGTQVELQRVGSVLERHGWKVDLYTGKNARAKTVKNLQAPRVLHLATHGFFLSDQERSKGKHYNELPSGTEEPMVRSGLYFAGADRTLSGKPSPPDLDDGVLTAYEASGLNLQGTELVVLSACETGLGQVKNGEGVFGLRRALQEAGAESVLMSLWSVPDRETQELMTLFYKHWLSGQEKQAALRSAQFALRKIVKIRYGQDRPFYWGGFVLAGK